MVDHPPLDSGPLSAELMAAYRSTYYWVLGLETALRIGSACPELDEVLVRSASSTAVFITAYNPRSMPQSLTQNQRRNDALRERISALGFQQVLEAEGRSADGRWAPESSFLVLGMSEEQADQLAYEYEQNAYVYYSAGLASLKLSPIAKD